MVGINWNSLLLVQVFFLSSAVIKALDNPNLCLFDRDQHLYGQFSSTELKWQEVASSLPSISLKEFKNQVYNMLKNDEFDIPMLKQMIENRKTAGTPRDRTITSFLLNDSYLWESYKPNKVYAWTIDLHPSPAACNQAIYKDIGVVLHAEVDHHPYCEYYGVCSTERLKVFSVLRGEGFSLDPDHNVLKAKFFEHYKENPEFKRIDVFVCSHPAANCEMFERFLPVSTKTLILYFTTRFEFGRDDMNINWRARVAGRWNALAEKDLRYKEWLDFVWKYHKSGRLILTANSVFDQQYVYYMTGIKPTYIPSWCGDYESVYTHDDWTGCTLSNDEPHYSPTRPEIIFVPYKQKLSGLNGFHEEFVQSIVQVIKDLSNGECKETDVQDLEVVNCAALKVPVKFQHSSSVVKSHTPSAYKKFPAVIMLSYQTSIMTFFEMYRLNIPMFAPSLNFLVHLDAKYQLVSGRLYGWPKRFPELIQENTGVVFNSSFPPDPNLKYGDPNYMESSKYWLQFSDIYHFPHIVLFDNWTHLIKLTQTTNLTDISHKMWRFNLQQRVQIMRDWDSVYQQAVPTKKRGKFTGDTFTYSSV